MSRKTALRTTKTMEIFRAMCKICTDSVVNSHQEIVDILKTEYGFRYVTRGTVNYIMNETRNSPVEFGGIFTMGAKGASDSHFGWMPIEGGIIPNFASGNALHNHGYAKTLATHLRDLFKLIAKSSTDPIDQDYYRELASAQSIVVKLMDEAA